MRTLPWSIRVHIFNWDGGFSKIVCNVKSSCQRIALMNIAPVIHSHVLQLSRFMKGFAKGKPMWSPVTFSRS